MSPARRAFLLRLFLSAIALFLVARLVSGRELLAALRRADLGPLFLAVAVSLGDRVMMAWKWRMLLHGVDILRPIGEAMPIPGKEEEDVLLIEDPTAMPGTPPPTPSPAPVESL